MDSALFKYLIVILLITNSTFATTKQGSAPAFIVGEHFQILPSNLNYISTKPDRVDSVTNKPQVIVFFNYGCFGCKQMNQQFNKWKHINQNKAAIYRYPVAFNKPWESLAKLYYVTQELFPQDDGEAIFQAIYHDNKRLWLEAEMIEFYEKRNITKDVFLQTYNSFDIDRKLKKAIEIANNYKIVVTPNIIIIGNKNSYMVNFTMVTEPETLFKVVDYLIQNNPLK